MTGKRSAPNPPRIAESADVHVNATIGDGTSIWGVSCVRENAVVGRDCTIGRGAYVEDGVIIGDRVKVQTNALIFKPARIGDDVFIGPGVILTNDRYPRACDARGRLKGEEDWVAEGVVVDVGASIGARTVILPGVSIGRYAMVGAGSTVAKDVGAFELVVGSPARRVGWVGIAGYPLEPAGATQWVCPITGSYYAVVDGELTPSSEAATPDHSE